MVAPYTGAWIEILSRFFRKPYVLVAPYTGAWIEIHMYQWYALPYVVAPYTGAWIEILTFIKLLICLSSRSLHGSVD